jgi:hypothetical protein
VQRVPGITGGLSVAAAGENRPTIGLVDARPPLSGVPRGEQSGGGHGLHYGPAARVAGGAEEMSSL